MDDRERLDRLVIGATLLILDSLVLWFLWTRGRCTVHGCAPERAGRVPDL